MTFDELRQEIGKFLKFSISDTPVQFTRHENVEEDGYRRLRIRYTSEEGDEIPAFLLIPDGTDPFGAILVHHQHHGQRHFGKSEVCGLVGDPLQAFGPVLARRGIVVLAPDSICFEDRRKNRTGTEPDEESDITQHFNEMCYRLLRGDSLMRKVLSDSAQGISLLLSHPRSIQIESVSWDILTAATRSCSMLRWMNASGLRAQVAQHVPIDIR